MSDRTRIIVAALIATALAAMGTWCLVTGRANLVLTVSFGTTADHVATGSPAVCMGLAWIGAAIATIAWALLRAGVATRVRFAGLLAGLLALMIAGLVAALGLWLTAVGLEVSALT